MAALWAVPLVSQGGATRPPVVLGLDVFDVDKEAVVARVPFTEYVAWVQWQGGSHYYASQLLIDIDARVVLGQRGEALVLRTLGDPASIPKGRRVEDVWERSLAELGLGATVDLAGVRFTAGRVVLGLNAAPGSGSGLLALERSSGDVAWAVDGLCGRLVALHGGQVFATGLDSSQEPSRHVLGAFSMRNGARASLVSLPGALRMAVPGDAGVAVVGDGWLRVYAAGGPELFGLDGAEAAWIQDVVPARGAKPDGARWFLAGSEGVVALDGQGEELWHAPTEEGAMSECCLVPLADGGVVALRWEVSSDSGVHAACLEGRGVGGAGVRRWATGLEGLGVSHSKYFHRVHGVVVGDRVRVVSQAAGGDFVAECRLVDGASELRVER